MTDNPIVALASLDRAAVMALNNDSAAETTWLDAADLDALLAESVYARGVAPAEALLIAMDQDAAYDSPNFRWLAARLARFVYVDRIIVSSRARGRGLGHGLYDDLAAWALAQGHDRIVCEVNTDPDNPASHAFHLRQGFRPIGDVRHGPHKAVRFYQRDIG